MSKQKILTGLLVLVIMFSPAITNSQTISFGIEQVESTMASSLWPNGALGLNLTGAGYSKIAMWGGPISIPYNHEDFTGRMIKGDVASTGNKHDTQVAGIIMASGSSQTNWDPIQEKAKGIAYETNLTVFNSGLSAGKMEADILQVAQNGYEIGQISEATYTDYSNFEATVDDIIYNNPNFLFIQAAGNSGTVLGQGKNELSVGSFNSITGRVENSAEGPAVDNRIKPDIVAPGGPTTTCVENGYEEITDSKTSFSAPVAAGIAVLLQQHYQNKYRDYPMSAATLKGLLIHTAENVGTPGPDVKYGWGKINAESAANLITNNNWATRYITQKKLRDGSKHYRSVWSNGEEPLKVTIVWTDPAGEPANGETLPILINDLDLKVFHNWQPSYPWSLDTNDPSLAARNDVENKVDNVEQVYIQNPERGWYTIVVTNDGTLLGGKQKYSMFVSGNATWSWNGSLESDEAMAEMSEENLVNDSAIITEFNLGNNYPNPFNPTTIFHMKYRNQQM